MGSTEALAITLRLALNEKVLRQRPFPPRLSRGGAPPLYGSVLVKLADIQPSQPNHWQHRYVPAATSDDLDSVKSSIGQSIRSPFPSPMIPHPVLNANPAERK